MPIDAGWIAIIFSLIGITYTIYLQIKGPETSLMPYEGFVIARPFERNDKVAIVAQPEFINSSSQFHDAITRHHIVVSDENGVQLACLTSRGHVELKFLGPPPVPPVAAQPAPAPDTTPAAATEDCEFAECIPLRRLHIGLTYGANRHTIAAGSVFSSQLIFDSESTSSGQNPCSAFANSGRALTLTQLLNDYAGKSVRITYHVTLLDGLQLQTGCQIRIDPQRERNLRRNAWSVAPCAPDTITHPVTPGAWDRFQVALQRLF